MAEHKKLTVEELRNAIPSRKNSIDQGVVDLINKVQTEPEFQGESIFQTMVTYQNVLRNSKVGLKEYISAIRFCAYLISENDNYTEAYKRVFCDRDFVKERINLPTDSAKYAELTSAASRYRRSKLVADIMSVSQMPMGLLFMGHQYDAVNVLYDTMLTAKLDRDKINAAKELLAAVKLPETQKIELDVGVKENSAVQDLNDQLAQLAGRQKLHLEAGSAQLEDFGKMKPKDEDVVEVDVDG